MRSGPGFQVSDSEEDMRSEAGLHVDVMSISSNMLTSSITEISNRDLRRNGRRLYWDALSRSSVRRHSDSPFIVFTAGQGNDVGPHDRWLLDLSDDLHNGGVGRGFGYHGSRSHRRNQRGPPLSHEKEFEVAFMSEVNELLFLHLGSTLTVHAYVCTYSWLKNPISLLISSQIVLLAEALFEYSKTAIKAFSQSLVFVNGLDEIHRQPLSLSVVLSLPAPESVVDSLPLKNHGKLDLAESGPNDVQQCYICLVEYEEGDELRVLPCHHEYHVSCVDKWLKEIKGVCPVCRCNVREGAFILGYRSVGGNQSKILFPAIKAIKSPAEVGPRKLPCPESCDGDGGR
ncbi:hypothetical protein RJ640_002387 [Escallonia rubra]|uniref:RING-type domain-containing protein n=1 Tax=Escallonia rubra TaxID=112253 RepID=A0AA88QNA4_9ASTE|nr:hypothetical protein RJ640_002387 [Escallonia rubra]